MGLGLTRPTQVSMIFSRMREIFVDSLQKGGLPSWLVPDYWFMLTLAIIVGSVLAIYLWRDAKQDTRIASDLLFWGIPALFVGAKFLYYLQFGFPDHLKDFWSPSGISLYGGLLGLLTAWTLYYQFRPYSVFLFLDSITPPLALGLCLGRIGCFLAGCNGGFACDLPWGVKFPRSTATFYHQQQAGLVEKWDKFSLPAHPTQLYESVFGAVAFVLLLFLRRQGLKQGHLFFAGILWYAVYRFSTEPLRADAGGVHPLGIFTFAQFVSVLAVLGSVIGLFYLSRVQTDKPRAAG